MKKLLFALILMAMGQSMMAQNDAVTKYFDQYKDDDNFTTVNISPKLFEMIANMAEEEIDDPEVLEMIQEMKGLKVLKTELTPMKFYNEAIAKLDTKGYSELVTVRDEDQNVKILSKEEDGGKIINEMLIIVGGEDEFVLVSIVGKMRMSKLAKLAKNMDIEGMEHLEKLDKE